MKKLTFASLLIFWLIACGQKSTPEAGTGSVNGADVYKKYCLLCHGADGKLGISGAKDITASQLTLAERITLIREGKNTMTPFKGVLSEEQIKAAAEYSMTLK